jgi:hypothetical protein
MRRATGLAVAATVLALAGCGAGDGKRAVTGTVTWKGQPLATGMIRFLPQDRTVSTETVAVITQGSYAVPKDKGLLPGVYSVSVSSPDPKSGQGPPDAPPGERGGYPASERIPAKYNTQTTLTFEVKANDENKFDVAVD